MDPTRIDAAFEILARDFLREHPNVRCEWREMKGVLSSRTDLVCGVGKANEVFASFNRGGQIAVGATSSSDHDDFEDFGRGLSDEEVAREAFERFVELLREHGHLTARA